MPLFLDQGVFALGVAAGGLGLVLAPSRIASYANEEPKLTDYPLRWWPHHF